MLNLYDSKFGDSKFGDNRDVWATTSLIEYARKNARRR